jgi:plasmid stabilization system protein ParE
MANKVIVWSNDAIDQLRAAIEYIAEDSVQNAEKVSLDLLNKVNEIASHSERYAPDKYKQDNDGSYRAFELHRYRIAYRTTETEIRILRIRHTSREPQLF